MPNFRDMEKLGQQNRGRDGSPCCPFSLGHFLIFVNFPGTQLYSIHFAWVRVRVRVRVRAMDCVPNRGQNDPDWDIFFLVWDRMGLGAGHYLQSLGQCQISGTWKNWDNKTGAGTVAPVAPLAWDIFLIFVNFPGTQL